MKKNLVLTGMMGVGKSAIGKLLADSLDRCFSDIDKNIENNKDKITRVGCSHFALTVDDLDKTYEDLIDLGLNFLDSPKKSADNNAKVCFCRDSDGTLIELVEEIKHRPVSTNV